MEPLQALEWLRSTAKLYCSVIPGASIFIDIAIDEIDVIRQKHQKEVDDIIKEAYIEMWKATSQESLNPQSAAKVWAILRKHLQRIANVGGKVGQDFLNKNPILREKVESNLDQLQRLGEEYGPKTKTYLDNAMQDIKTTTEKNTGKVWHAVQNVLESPANQSSKVKESHERKDE